MSTVTTTGGTVRVITVTIGNKVATIFEPKSIITVTDRGRQGATGGQGTQGIQGPPGSPPLIKVQFTFTDGPSLIIVPLVNGDTIVDSEVVIETTFDDVAATLSLGSVADDSLILSTSENRPSTIGNYGNQENFKFAITEQIRIYINPGTSTQGSGHVLISKI